MMKVDLRKHTFQFISFVDVYHDKASRGGLNINDDHHAMHIIKGEGSVTVDKMTYPISRGSVIMVGPFREFRLRIEPDFAMRNIHYRLWTADGEAIEQRWKLPYVFRPSYFGHTAKLLADFMPLVHEPIGNMAKMAALGHELILEHWQETAIEPSGPTDMDERMETVYRMLTSGRYMHYDAEELAEACCLSVSQMNRRFKRHFKMSPQKLWEAKRLSSICMAIKKSECSIKQVAETFGFEDAAYFSRWFKKRSGSSPMEYRKTIAGETVL